MNVNAEAGYTQKEKMAGENVTTAYALRNIFLKENGKINQNKNTNNGGGDRRAPSFKRKLQF